MNRKRYHQINILLAMIIILVLVCAVVLAGIVWKRSGKQELQGENVLTQSSLAVDTKEAGNTGDAAAAESADTAKEVKEDPSEHADAGDSTSVDEQAQAILDNMSLEEKVGQLFIARCPEEQAAQKAAEYHLGGYILFARDFEGKTPEEVSVDIQSYQSAASIPMLIGVDEEGGTVNRVSRYPAFRAEKFESPQKLYQNGGFEAVKNDTVEKSQLLKSLGINVNFAPVCDVSVNSEDFIYDRSFGKEAGETAQYVETVVGAMKEQRMGSVLKHFPGYGNNVDTHTGIAYDNRSYETFLTSDFLPFQAGIDSGAEMVLVSHNIVKSMDEQYPASLSPRVHEILRQELGFSGVIVTDDLVMDGVREFADDGQVAVLAVQAGNDLLCCTDFETQVPAVLEAVKRGEISQERLDQSVLRILKMKIAMNLPLL